MQKNVKWFILPFAMIIVSFIFWGIGTKQDAPTSQILAEIGPYKLESQHYWRVYEQMANYYRSVLKEQFTEEMLKALDLKNKVLEELVQQKILLIAAEENGIKVTDRQLQDAIMSDATFMRDGYFDRNIYLRTLQLNRISPSQYEQSKRDELATERIRRLILETYGASATGSDKDNSLLLKQQTALKAFVDGYKLMLQKKGEYKVNMDLIS
jgi:peptidyl-prolyl cis-trans isomerase D